MTDAAGVVATAHDPTIEIEEQITELTQRLVALRHERAAAWQAGAVDRLRDKVDRFRTLLAEAERALAEAEAGGNV